LKGCDLSGNYGWLTKGGKNESELGIILLLTLGFGLLFGTSTPAKAGFSRAGHKSALIALKTERGWL
jgi:hypothetical protein